MSAGIETRVGKMIDFECPECGNGIHVPESAAGKHGKCKACGESIVVPGLAIAVIRRENPLLMIQEPESPSFDIRRAEVHVSVDHHDRTPQRSNSFGIAAIVLGIPSLMVCWIPLVNVLSGPLALLGILLSVIGIVISVNRRGYGLGYPIAGGFMCVLAISIGVFVHLSVQAGLEAVIKEMDKAEKEFKQKFDVK